MLVHVGPQPTLDNSLVGLEHITSQSETGVQKILVVLAYDVQVLHQTEQAGAVKITQLGFDLTPSGGGFVLVCHVEHCGVGAGAAVKTRTSAFVSSQDRQITKLREVVLCAYLGSLLAWWNGCSALPDLGPFRTGSPEGRLWRKAVAGILSLIECASGRTISRPSQLICAESHAACVGRALQSQRTCVGNGP
jgi:hypothetical protein